MTSPVTVFPLCPVACGATLFTIGGELRVAVVAKATFALAHERSAWPTSPLPLVQADISLPQGASARLIAASELTPPLPGAGLILSGTARAPGGRPTTEMAVRLALFQDGRAAINKHLRIVGHRAGPDDAPAPFTEMPIVYERAYGGAQVAENPCGVGTEAAPQPNILDPRSPSRPAGFGPVAATWAARASLLREVRGESATGWTIPVGFDFAAFHAAPSDQRLDDALRGDEWLVLDGFHANFPRLQTQLPFVHAEARVARTDRPGSLEQLQLAADTIVVDADAMLASVIWRGAVSLASAADAERIRIFVGLELPGFPIPWPTPSSAPARPAAADVPSSDEPAWPEIPDVSTERDIREIRAALLAERANVAPPESLDGLDVTAEVASAPPIGSSLPFAPSTRSALPKPIRAGSPPARAWTGTTDVDQRAFRAVLPFSRGAPVARVVEQEPPRRDRESTTAPLGPTDPVDVTRGLDAAKVARPPLPFDAGAKQALDAHPSTMRAPGVSNETTQPELVTLVAAAAPTTPNAEVAEPCLLSTTAAAGLRLSIETRRREGASLQDLPLKGADLRGLDLDDADLRGVDLTGAILAKTSLRRAKLRGARLSGADLTAALLDEADLSGADLTRAVLQDAVLERANLANANLTRSHGEGARAAGASAPRATFSRAMWSRADFTGSQLEGADLRAAGFGSARFVDAVLSDALLVEIEASGAVFDGARLTGASLNMASLTKATLVGVDAVGSTWEDAELAGASFDGARLERSRLTRASAERASFEGADLRHANLNRLDAPGANLSKADLRGAEMRQAKLAGAAFDGANLNEVQSALTDFSDASFRDAQLIGANLRETNLEGALFAGASLDRADLRDARLANAEGAASRRGTRLPLP